MIDINRTFEELLNEYKKVFKVSRHRGNTRGDFGRSLPDVSGVFIILRISEPELPIYIGSSGKIRRNLETNNATIRDRMTNAYTPFNFKDSLFLYDPMAGSPPVDYNASIPLNELEVVCFEVPPPKAPVVLANLFMQGVVNEFRGLPLVNQEL